jgi:DNA-binding transcriptional regulator YiaG
MSAVTVAQAFADEIHDDPAQAVERLLAADSEAAAVLVQLLERHLSGDPLRRIERVWQLSASQTAAMFNVSRQAYSKWRSGGVPADRREDVRQLDESTQIMLEHVRVERIAATVRRAAPSLGGLTLIQVATQSGSAAARNAVRDTFDLTRVQP